MDFLEIEVDYFLDAPRRRQDELKELSEQFRIIPRAAQLSLGSADGMDERYLDKLARFIDAVEPPWWCEHLAFSRAGATYMGSPVPLPRIPASLRALERNVEHIRQRIHAPLILENVTSIVDLPGNVMTEMEFLTEALERTQCGLLLDVANLHVNAINHGLDTSRLLHQLPLHRVVQLHVAGGHWDHGLLLDSHTQPVSPEVWCLVDQILVPGPGGGHRRGAGRGSGSRFRFDR